MVNFDFVYKYFWILSIVLTLCIYVNGEKSQICKSNETCLSNCYCLNEEVFCIQKKGSKEYSPKKANQGNDNPDGTPFQCKEGSKWRQECNFCSCTDGLQTCTLIACAPDFVLTGPECENGSEWKASACTVCKCENEKAVCNDVSPRDGVEASPLSSEIKPAIYITSKTLTADMPPCKEGIRRRGCYICTCVYGSEVCDKMDCSTEKICNQPVDPGPCQPFVPIPRFAFENEECKMFFYGGCEGNANNFITQEDCNNVCGKGPVIGYSIRDPKKICNMPLVVGPCRGAIPRFGFNPTLGRCELFSFGGCQGNENNFLTQEDCEKICGKQSLQFGYTTPKSNDKCSLSLDAGPCDGVFPRYAFYVEKESCGMFTYGGCGGNENNFMTLEECQNECGGSPSPMDKCSLPLEVGPCEALIPRYAFVVEKNRCEKFIYGGCQGNENNFITFEECYKECGKGSEVGPTTLKSTDKCSLPIQVGPCFALIPRFAFFAEKGRCKEFNYGGCEGNENNFMTLEECNKECGMTR